MGQCMKQDQIEALAIYFTGHAVIQHSISLGLPPGINQSLAAEFFAARSALGISGYATRDEAITAIKRSIQSCST